MRNPRPGELKCFSRSLAHSWQSHIWALHRTRLAFMKHNLQIRAVFLFFFFLHTIPFPAWKPKVIYMARLSDYQAHSLGLAVLREGTLSHADLFLEQFLGIPVCGSPLRK